MLRIPKLTYASATSSTCLVITSAHTHNDVLHMLCISNNNTTPTMTSPLADDVLTYKEPQYPPPRRVLKAGPKETMDV
ncbi:hypothetical protein Pcinc_014383 [Petrolisthes cinctipes]|uniref:Uncharacterized protein n=1 Tax=Petrolisthes cinctipes TaxID=88211 RepID=A0AAE1FV41_PETCI|nr:hypothetical protein Pcinc_014383 [Petrolisthes cinctipes]